MYYLEEEMSLQVAHETHIYRVFGGDVELKGSYVTDALPENPIQARSDLALSQYDFDVRNLACGFAEATIYTNDNGKILTLEGEQTEHELKFTEVAPVSDLPGGGQEYHLQDDWEKIIQVNSVEILKHESTTGWKQYVENEKNMEQFSDNGIEQFDEESLTVATLLVDDMIDEEIYTLQKEDVDGQYIETFIGSDDGRDDRWTGDEDVLEKTYVEESLDQLLDDELYEIQTAEDNCKNDIDNQFYYSKPINEL